MAELTTLPEVVSGDFRLNMPEEEYHSHHALSASGMKHLLRSPLHYRMQRNMNHARSEFDVGHAVHALVLGVGMPIVAIPDRMLAINGAASTKDAKAFIAEAREKGQVPLKTGVYTQIITASEAVLRNTKARDLLERDGYSEVSLFATDPVTGVHLRGRLDRLAGSSVIDVKSTTDVRERKLQSAIADFGYDVQAEVYRLLVELVLGIEADPVYLIFAEKEFPHEVRVVRLGEDWQEGGHRKMRAAIDLFAWCSERGEWPGDDEDGGPVVDLPAPGYYLASIERDSA
jgi:hypothetical protein